jgi:CDP-glycerol glycerophosphotransferase
MLFKIDAIFERIGCYTFLGYILGLIPKDNNLMVWTSYPSFGDSVWIYYEYCKQEYPEKNHVWIQARKPVLEVPKDVISYNFWSIKGIAILLRAKVIFTNNNEFYRLKSRNQILIDFWHGIPIKNILNYDNALGTRIQKHAYKTSYRVSPSRIVTLLLSSAFGDHPNKYLEIGSLRVDRILSTDKEFVKSKLGLEVNLKYALFMPTYRKGYRSKQDGAQYDEEELFNELKRRLNLYGYALLIKPHPFVEDIWEERYSDIITSKSLALNGLITSDLLAMTDLLITDYSSLLIDYLVTGKPLIILNLDKESYKSSRGFIFDVTKYLKANVATCLDDIDLLLSNIEIFRSKENAEDFLRSLYFDYLDSKSAVRLTKELKRLHPHVF